MKRFFLTMLNKFAVFTGWRWLYFLAGIGLLGGIHSCKTVIKKCYSPVEVPDNDTIVHTRCYDMPVPPDTIMDTHDDNEEMR